MNGEIIGAVKNYDSLGKNFRTFNSVDDDVYTAPQLWQTKTFWSLFKAQKNNNDTDSDDENEMNNAAPVPMSSEMRNVMNNEIVVKLTAMPWGPGWNPKKGMDVKKSMPKRHGITLNAVLSKDWWKTDLAAARPENVTVTAASDNSVAWSSNENGT
ncbi:hypothetical protein TNCV_2722451 [Trichonephila clavipes]|nr:hypothetical protein TNCV_2722451 [Trichonephila clavipes]